MSSNRMAIALVLSLLGHIAIFAASGFTVSAVPVKDKKVTPVIFEIPEDYKELPRYYIRSQTKKIANSESSEKSESNHGINPAADDYKVTDPADETMLRYHEIIKQKIEDMRIYPSSARHRFIEGTVHVVFMLKPTGEIISAAVRSSSDYPSLDRAALEAVQRAAPFPPFKDFCNSPRLMLDVVIVYAL